MRALTMPTTAPAHRGYYTNLPPTEGPPSLSDLQKLVSTGHKYLSYNAARDGMFQLVFDTDGDNSITGVYTGRVIHGIGGYRDAYKAGMNTEHVWPQSLGATGKGRTDLHQLMPTDSNANSSRGSLPFGEVAQQDWGVDAKRGRDMLGRTVFEPPNEMKGDVARKLLYFYTRYNGTGTSKFSTANFEVELPILLKWHAADPVDELERARNDAAHSIQGNRNPYIDNPQWVQYLDFSGDV